ncbi:MAG: phosphotransferase family protein [Ruminococcaceae bacterium]|nr:phosphotransferase family protein [Oscillospiraceae bacterium]
MAKEIVERDLILIDDIVKNVIGVDSYSNLFKLEGLTNRSYSVNTEKGQFVIRIPGEGTEELINRDNERISTELACKIGIDEELLYFGEDGIKVTGYISNAITMTPELLREPVHIKQVAKIFKILHTSNVDTGVPFEVFDMAKGYEDLLMTNNVGLYDDYHDIKQIVMTIKEKVDKNGKAKRVPCHNDPLCGNWVEGNGRMYLIDWEYAGMNDGMWDLADISIEAVYGPKEDEILLKEYFGYEPSEKDMYKFNANKIYLDYLWTLWGLTRVPFDGEELADYALNRYNRLKENLKKFSL